MVTIRTLTVNFGGLSPTLKEQSSKKKYLDEFTIYIYKSNILKIWRELPMAKIACLRILNFVKECLKNTKKFAKQF